MRRLMLGVGCLAVLAELTINYDVTGFDTVSRTAYLSNRKGYQSVLSSGTRSARQRRRGRIVLPRGGA